MYETLSILVSRQREYLIGSTEKGMHLVRDNKNYAVIGGRETFYYDIKRFGKKKTQKPIYAQILFSSFIIAHYTVIGKSVAVANNDKAIQFLPFLK